jgi:hypothetical protein
MFVQSNITWALLVLHIMSKGWLASLPIVNIDMMSRIKYSRNAKVHSYEARCKLRPITSHTFITMLKKTPLVACCIGIAVDRWSLIIIHLQTRGLLPIPSGTIWQLIVSSSCSLSKQQNLFLHSLRYHDGSSLLLDRCCFLRHTDKNESRSIHELSPQVNKKTIYLSPILGASIQNPRIRKQGDIWMDRWLFDILHTIPTAFLFNILSLKHIIKDKFHGYFY